MFNWPSLTGLLLFVMQNPLNVFNNNGKLEVKLDCVMNKLTVKGHYKLKIVIKKAKLGNVWTINIYVGCRIPMVGYILLCVYSCVMLNLCPPPPPFMLYIPNKKCPFHPYIWNIIICEYIQNVPSKPKFYIQKLNNRTSWHEATDTVIILYQTLSKQSVKILYYFNFINYTNPAVYLLNNL